MHGEYRNGVHATLELSAGVYSECHATRGVIDRARYFTEVQQYVCMAVSEQFQFPWYIVLQYGLVLVRNREAALE